MTQPRDMQVELREAVARLTKWSEVAERFDPEDAIIAAYGVPAGGRRERHAKFRADVVALLRDLASGAEGWRPIETFVYVPGTEPPKVQIYQSETGVETAQFVPPWSSRTPGWWATVPGRWQRQPSHYRPLPAAPIPPHGKTEVG